MGGTRGVATTHGGGEGGAGTERPAEKQPPAQTQVGDGLTGVPSHKLTSVWMDALGMFAALSSHLPRWH